MDVRVELRSEVRETRSQATGDTLEHGQPRRVLRVANVIGRQAGIQAFRLQNLRLLVHDAKVDVLTEDNIRDLISGG